MSEPQILLSAEHLKHNFQVLRETYGKLPLFPVIKAQAYGHGIVEVAKLLEAQSSAGEAPFFCVARMSEAKVLRAAGIRRKILVLSAYDAAHLMRDLPSDVQVSINSWPDLKMLLQTIPRTPTEKFSVHLNFDTGMHRLGIDVGEVLARTQEFLDDLLELSARGVRVEGIMSHLACSEAPVEVFSNAQSERFALLLKSLRASWNESLLGPFPIWLHLSNSEGISRQVGLPQGSTACRAGLHLWGAFSTTREWQGSALSSVLKPVLSVRTPLKRLYLLRAGEGVGYGQIFKTKHPRLIGTFALGYADGLPRALSRTEEHAWKIGLVVEGVRVPFAGIVSMDLCAVDLSEHPRAKEWEKTLGDLQAPTPTLWGYWIHERQRVEEIADTMGSISYEIFCRLAMRVKRTATDEETTL